MLKARRFKLTHYPLLTLPPLDSGTDQELCSCLVLMVREGVMVRAVVEEAATLASLALFLGMIAIWAQVIATL